MENEVQVQTEAEGSRGLRASRARSGGGLGEFQGNVSWREPETMEGPRN